MCNGYTGKPLRSKIFIGTSYYQKLKHMVTDKIHARSYGNVTSLTRQPLAGRSKDGGLRLGEMERDCLLAHGSVSFLRERLFDMSDAFSVLICNACGVMSNNSQECHICKNNELIRTNTPYASKLLFQMLNGCLIKTKFHAVTE
jgi:DNA-directed RNA polymerase II subunit RPB2